MSQLAVILTFLLVGSRELLGPLDNAAADTPLWHYLGGFVAIWIAGSVAIGVLARRVDRYGSIRAAMSARRAAALMCWGALGLHAWNVLALGWVEVVRARLGNLIGVDEILAASPVVVTWLIAWWAIAPVERRLHEAMLFRRLETGGPVYPPLSRAGYVWMTFRHHSLFLIVPIVLVLSWGECVDRLGRRLGWGQRSGDSVDVRALGAEIAGVLLVFWAMPFLLRLIWDTVPLGEGDFRAKLVELADQAGAKFRQLLVWRTRGNVVNGLVAGMTPGTRHVLLSDALLDSLSERQVEAVAAHEYGHIRRRHIAWLGVTMVGVMVAMGVVAEVGTRVLERAGISPEHSSWGLTAATVAVGLWVFGWVSRKFEWQADAFAVQCLSGGWRAGKLASGVIVSEEAAAAMAGALQGVADLNGVPRTRFGWRHGSIATRQGKLARLMGAEVARLPIDREVRWIKVGALTILAAAIAGAWWLGG